MYIFKHPAINSSIIDFGVFSIKWYSISYILGFILGYTYIKHILKKFKLSFEFELLEIYLNYIVISVIIGGRLGYVFIYDPIKYLNDPIEIFKTYKGGMSFHGALIGIIVSSYLFGKKYNKDFLLLTDLLSISAPIGIFFGRIANFVNQELVGRYAYNLIGVLYPFESIPRHPSQLYEAVFEGLVIFVIFIYLVFKHNFLSKQGYLSSLFLILYSLSRFLIEFLREPDSQLDYIIYGLTMGQVISVISFMIGFLVLTRISYKEIGSALK